MNEIERARADEILGWFLAEQERAETVHPGWPSDAIHAAAIVGAETGELLEAATNHHYRHDNGTRAALKLEAIQVGAMALNVLLHMGEYGQDSQTAAATQAEPAKRGEKKGKPHGGAH